MLSLVSYECALRVFFTRACVGLIVFSVLCLVVVAQYVSVAVQVIESSTRLRINGAYNVLMCTLHLIHSLFACQTFNRKFEFQLTRIAHMTDTA